MTKYGQTWWGAKWLNALSHIDYSNRLPRGRNYANKSAVEDLRLSGRKIIANVKSSRIKSYNVTVGISRSGAIEKPGLLFYRSVYSGWWF